MNIMKRINLIAIIFMFIFTSIIIYMPADSKAQTISPTGRNEYYGYFENNFYGRYQYTADLVNGGIEISANGIAEGTVLAPGDGSSSARAREFILRVYAWLYNPRDPKQPEAIYNQNKTAAQFIVLTMMGKSGGTSRSEVNSLFNAWSAKVLEYAQNERINFDVYNGNRNGWNSTYQRTYVSFANKSLGFQPGGFDDVTMYQGTIASGFSIVFYHPNGSVYEIRKACVNPVGQLAAFPNTEIGPPTLVIDAPNHEKGSGDKTVNYKLNLNGRALYCGGLSPTFNVTINTKIFGAPKPARTIILNNCQAYNEVLLGSDIINEGVLNDRLIGSNNPIELVIILPDGRQYNQVRNINIFSAPFVLFNGNDVRACPADIDNARFVFKPGYEERGSRNWLGSFWGTSGLLENNSSQGWSKGLNTFNKDTNPKVNHLKSSGISCDGFDGSGLTGNQEIAARTNYTGINSVQAENVLISGNLTTTYPNKFTDNPPVYKIKANNVYISEDVSDLQGVIIEAKNVYTCSERGKYQKVSNDELDNRCTKKLIVVGTVNAQKIELMRTAGTRYLSDGGASQAAEVFLYPAYFFFTNVGGSSGEGRIQSYSQAPPRL